MEPMMNRNELIEYIQNNYGVDPEYPWARAPTFATFKHGNNAKWFAVVMDIAAKKVVENGGEEKIDIVNVKVPPELVGSLRLQKDIYPAYHMNKEHWVTVKLGGEVSAAELISLVDESYRLTV